MKIDYNYLHRQIVLMRSQNYQQYANSTELDLLVHLLNHEDITDYGEVEWAAFHVDLVGPLPKPSARALRRDFTLEFAPKSKLEQFVKGIIPREETIRVVTYLRDHHRECLFGSQSLTYYKNQAEMEDMMVWFENDCARIISKEIEESRRDRVHGDFLLWPRPNLREIAMGEKKHPQRTDVEKIILTAIPSYPGDKQSVSKEDILDEAKMVVDMFVKQVDKYEQDKEERDKPKMSVKEYVEPIWNDLQRRANRYLYYDKCPAYQALWVMAVLMRIPGKTKHSWWEQRFAEQVPVYLDTTKYFNGYKAKIDATVEKIRQLTEPRLDFGGMYLPTGVVAKKPALDTSAPIIVQGDVHIETNNGAITNIEKSHVAYN